VAPAIVRGVRKLIVLSLCEAGDACGVFREDGGGSIVCPVGVSVGRILYLMERWRRVGGR
jgi:hypothetical protein